MDFLFFLFIFILSDSSGVATCNLPDLKLIHCYYLLSRAIFINISPCVLFAVIASINMKKGGPRTSLFELCKKMQWPMPTLEATENKSRLALPTMLY